MRHKKQIFVKCWNCDKEFDIVTAERCYRHLTGGFTTMCSHCHSCICHKVDKMEKIKCKVLNKVEIHYVMPSVKRKLEDDK